jgi:long-subunit acyl-CoA synthetase (AMP-forming)
MTDTSSIFKNPSSLAGVSSSKLEIQLNYLAKELELERLRREKLQKQVEEMQENLNRQRIESEREVEKFRQEKETREKNVKAPNMDLDDLRVLQKGFFSLQ